MVLLEEGKRIKKAAQKTVSSQGLFIVDPTRSPYHGQEPFKVPSPSKQGAGSHNWRSYIGFAAGSPANQQKNSANVEKNFKLL